MSDQYKAASEAAYLSHRAVAVVVVIVGVDGGGGGPLGHSIHRPFAKQLANTAAPIGLYHPTWWWPPLCSVLPLVANELWLLAHACGFDADKRPC